MPLKQSSNRLQDILGVHVYESLRKQVPHPQLTSSRHALFVFVLPSASTDEKCLIAP